MNIDTISHRLFQLAFIALALFIPFSIAGANIAIGFGLLAWLLSAVAARTGRPAQTPGPSVLRDPILPAALLLAVSAIPSVIISKDFTRAINDWRSYWLLSIYFLVAANLAVHRLRDTTFWVLFASTTASCVVGFVQLAGGLDLWFVHIGESHRLESTLFAMTFAGILCQVLILNSSVALQRRLRNRWSFVLGAGLAIQLIGLILTSTRGAWVALFAGLAAVTLLIRSKTVLVVSAVIASVILIFAFTAVEQHGRNVSPLKLLTERDAETSTRLVLWDVAWELFKDNPIWGVGMGDFEIEAREVLDGRAVKTTTDTHNVYLHVLATRGLVGFIPFVIFWFVLLRTLFRYKRRLEKGSLDWHYAVAAIGVTVAILFGALTENNLYDEEVFIAFMFVLGLTRSADYARRPDETADRGQGP